MGIDGCDFFISWRWSKRKDLRKHGSLGMWGSVVAGLRGVTVHVVVDIFYPGLVFVKSGLFE
jgi:hypothetical protein